MSVRNYPGGAGNGSGFQGNGVSGATTGVKVTYTVPAGVQAKGTWISVVPTAGAATIQILARIGGVVYILWQGTTQIQFTGGPALQAGDSIRINVSVLDAASLFDAVISADEFGAT